MHAHGKATGFESGVDKRMREPRRLDAVHALRLLDTPAEDAFDRLTRLAARLLRAPIALVSVVDGRRQFFKSAYGLPEPWASLRETPLSHSFCKHVVASAAPLSITDSRQHPLVCRNAAIGDLGVVAYLGAPLTLTSGIVIGSFCVIDTKPRAWTTSERQTMADLAASIMSEIALHITRGDPSAGHSANALSGTTAHAFNAQRAALTKRQGEVFDLLMHGLQTKEIARALDLSHRTVEVHRAMIRERLHVSSFSQLIKQRLGGRDTE